jgi:tRNA nucleotidyltransferase (CCA-adding enzyme)
MGEVLISRRPADSEMRRWLARLDRLHAGGFLRVALARWQASERANRPVPAESAVRSLHRRMRASMFRDPIELADLAVSGDDLRRMGIPAGPIYAKILHALLELVLDDPVRNTPAALLAEVPTIVAALDRGSGSRDKPSSEH